MWSFFGWSFMLVLTTFIHVKFWHYSPLRCSDRHACCLRHIGWSLQSSLCHLTSYSSSSRTFNYATCLTFSIINSHTHHWRLWSGCFLSKSEEISPLSWRHSFIWSWKKSIWWRLTIKDTLSCFFHLFSFKFHKIYLIEGLQIVLRLISFDFPCRLIPEEVFHQISMNRFDHLWLEIWYGLFTWS